MSLIIFQLTVASEPIYYYNYFRDVFIFIIVLLILILVSNSIYENKILTVPGIELFDIIIALLAVDFQFELRKPNVIL